MVLEIKDCKKSPDNILALTGLFYDKQIGGWTGGNDMFGNYRQAVNENIPTLLSPPHHSQGSCPS